MSSLNLSSEPWQDEDVNPPSPAHRVSSRIDLPSTEELPTRLLLFSSLVQEHLGATAASFGLTFQQAWALRILDEPRPMGELAEAMRCDPSNVTGIVDRLEGRGLIRRRMDEHDRRVRRLEVTPTGRTLRRRFEQRLSTGMPGMGTLSEAETHRLLQLFRKMTPDPDC
jgi:DNA-binding MarR family transcriptional regulator